MSCAITNSPLVLLIPLCWNSRVRSSEGLLISVALTSLRTGLSPSGNSKCPPICWGERDISTEHM